MSRLLTMTFTTADFVRSSSWRFGASPYRAAPKGPPSSLAQHDAYASSWHNAFAFVVENSDGQQIRPQGQLVPSKQGARGDQEIASTRLARPPRWARRSRAGVDLMSVFGPGQPGEGKQDQGSALDPPRARAL